MEDSLVKIMSDMIDGKLVPVKENIVRIEGDIVQIKENIVRIEENIVRIEEDIVQIKQDIVQMKSEIKTMKQTIEQQNSVILQGVAEIIENTITRINIDNENRVLKKADLALEGYSDLNRRVNVLEYDIENIKNQIA